MEYKILQHDGFVEVLTVGDAEPSVFQEFVQEVLRLDKWNPGTPILTNHTELNAGPLTISEVHELANIAATFRAELGRCRMASLVGRDLEFGLARMWEVFVEDRWDGETHVFRERADAVDWLLKS